MDVQEAGALMGSQHIFKGKRTKRQRTISSFLMLTAGGASSCSSGAEGSSCGGGTVFVDVSPDRFTASPSDSGDELAQSSVEEEDMANCLILLARGSSQKASPPQEPGVGIHVISRAPVVDVYQCKTCDRCFPSFQALGGHRASHKRPKVNLEEKKPGALLIGKSHETTVRLVNVHDDTSTALSLQIPGRSDLCMMIGSNRNKSRVHECSICGAEFSSGQALGGHMRRHRPLPATTVASTSSNEEEDSQELKKQKTLLSLDLNLPAPEPSEEDGRESKYPAFTTSKQEPMVFSSSPACSLVDCHY